ncbi:uncharacterized protein LOC120079912 [Benincasa hispida]|uniref:uncharacterized protein LOC120079912 n=1 Tax=Benincasa hispida TaxID=102211 RepID=UPI0018FF5B5E|nr:uncharacterized protein LOC120079912 [Benincasa hispida]XP_038890294.1 uncharacterized protein LOC120079912 [Benincasa hispida]XP_038890295.1 uncharacterized protein LOC120079912 [Benincasa hispida]
MAYIPPHKRHSRDMEKPSPTAELLAPQFNRKLNLRPSAPHFVRKDLRPSGRKVDRSGKIVYANQAINKWFSIGSSDDGNLFPSCVHLEPFSVQAIEDKRGEKPLALVNSNISQGNREEEEEVITEPWASIVVNLLPDLLSSVGHAKNEMDQDADVKLTLVAKIGKVLFHGISEIDKNDVPNDMTLRQLKRSFYTNVSDACIDHITAKVIPQIGVEFEEEKDIYHMKLSDARRPDVTLSCKCTTLPELNKLKLYKVDLNPVRHMVVDISCLKQSNDMRLMLRSKKTLEKLTDDEMEGIVDLINSAVLDQDAMGGLRWPLGKATSGDRFRVIGVWHTVAKSYVNPFVRLTLRNADRYDFRTSIGEVTKEVTMKLKQVTSELLREKAEYDVISDMLNDQLKMFWNHFVSSTSCLSSFIST